MNINVNELPKLQFIGNWTVKNAELTNLVVRLPYDITIEQIANSLTNEIKQSANTHDIKIGLADEVSYIPERRISVRTVEINDKLHKGCIDITMRSQPNSIYFDFKAFARTPITYLSYFLLSSIFLILLFSSLSLYFQNTGALHQLVMEYADKKCPGEATLACREHLWQGKCEIVDGAIRCNGKPDIIKYFLDMPMVFILGILWPVGAVAGIIGIILRLSKQRLLTFVCRIIGWPTPSEFSTFVDSHAMWVQSTVSHVLLNNFGISREFVHLSR